MAAAGGDDEWAEGVASILGESLFQPFEPKGMCLLSRIVNGLVQVDKATDGKAGEAAVAKLMTQPLIARLLPACPSSGALMAAIKLRSLYIIAMLPDLAAVFQELTED